MKYRVVKGFQWRDCTVYGREGEEIGAAELATADGEPLPESVLALLVRKGNLVPVEDEAKAAAKTVVPARGSKPKPSKFEQLDPDKE